MADTSRGAAETVRGLLELVVLLGDGVIVHPLPERGRVTIGRDADCDVCVRDASVSRRHAVLHMGDTLRIVDLDSANGTSIRRAGEPPGPHDTRPLRRRPGATFDVTPGDRIVLGTTVAVVRQRTPSAVPRDGDDQALGPAMRAIYSEARRAAQGELSVLLLGETGVGKEVLARAIHRLSPRAAGPFVAIHCASLPESLLEGELFGHEKGAFTGADTARPGLFEAADGGTAFLDEVGELPLGVQVKLLRVLDQRSVQRLGARAPRTVDVRFVAATNRNIEAEVKQGAFRQDLLYRLNAIELTIPPLRERAGEIRGLAATFLEEAWSKSQPAPELSEEVLQLLERYPWPGNVRELRNVIDRAVLLCDGEALTAEHLPRSIVVGRRPPPDARDGDPAPAAAGAAAGAGLLSERRAAGDEVERRRIVEALEQCGGNQTRAAAMLGISRRTLVTRLGQYELPRPRKGS